MLLSILVPRGISVVAKTTSTQFNCVSRHRDEAGPGTGAALIRSSVARPISRPTRKLEKLQTTAPETRTRIQRATLLNDDMHISMSSRNNPNWGQDKA